MKKTSAYCMKNGILHVDGKATFGIGSHYYPSYHPCKVPTPENGDRIGSPRADRCGHDADRGAGILFFPLSLCAGSDGCGAEHHGHC